MKYIEHRRHTKRNKPSIHISQEGILKAQSVGKLLKPFDLVVTSTHARAIETAVAMGFAVIDTNEFLAQMPDEVFNEIIWDEGFQILFEGIQKSKNVRSYLLQLQKLFFQIFDQLPENGRALCVSHGGIVEASALALLQNQNWNNWGGKIKLCEGVGFTLSNQSEVTGKLLRI